MLEPLTVAVVDDDAGARRSLAWLIESAGYRVQCFASASEFLRQATLSNTGCLVLDNRMPQMSGLELFDRLHQMGEQLPTLFITGHGEVSSCATAFREGALDFLEKPVADEVLLDRVRRGMDLRRQQLEADEIWMRYRELTLREREVLHLICRGRRLKEIAVLLDIGWQTAAKHRARVLSKMQAENDVELAELVRRARPLCSIGHNL